MNRFLFRSPRLLSLGAIVLLAPLASAEPQPATPVVPAPGESTENKDVLRQQAKEHYEKARVLFSKNKDYAAALAEFLESRRLYPTWNATSSSAYCLQSLHRYDEALDMYEVLLRDYEKELPEKTRTSAQRALASMRELVGAISIVDAEREAGIRIDGQNRGNVPASAPLRVSAGSHIVRVYKEGYEPFETNVDVAGKQVQTVHAKLRKLDLDQAGILRVSEANGRVLDVIIDGNIVGQTPWQGHLRDGEHSVVLEGEGTWGTQPAIVQVQKGRSESLGLLAEQLGATIQIMPTPAGATVAIDGVSVGRGVWQGRVRTGKHRIEIAANGYVLYVKELSFTKGANAPLTVKLDRDPLSPLWKDNRGRVYVEAALGPGIVPTFGGDVVKQCAGDCSQWVGIGATLKAHGGYRFPSGFFVGLDVGYGYARQKVSNRETTLNMIAQKTQAATVNDTLSFGGALVGASAGIRIGKALPLSFRLGAGALLGARFRDHRVGSSVAAGQVYDVDLIRYEPLTALYVEPTVQVAFPLAERLHLQVGVDALVLITPTAVPTWRQDETAPRVLVGGADLAVFPGETLMGRVLLLVAPDVSIRYEL